MTNEPVAPRPGWLRTLGPTLVAWFVVTSLTGAHFWGDSVDYVESVLDRHEFWDFGHLFWRPLGWLLAKGLLPVTSWMGAVDDRSGVLMLLVSVCYLTGLLSVLFLRMLFAEVGIRPLAADLSILAFLISQTFLNFLHTASSYVSGLCCLIIGLYLLARASRMPERATGLAVGAGVALAFSLCFWFPYVWALPAAGLLPPVLAGVTRTHVRLTIVTGVVCALVVILANVGALAAQGIYSVDGARTWLAASQHGITGINGVPRMLFGLARSFIYLGNDGTLYRRYLGKDSLNPISLLELTKASLWHIGLFYLFLGGMALGLLRSPLGRRLLVLLIIAALPILGFAVAWQGGDMERYLALYPFLFLALGGLLDGERVSWVCKGLAFAFFAVTAVSNALIMATPVLNQRQEDWARQAAVIVPHLKSPKNTLFTLNDQMARLRRDYPLNPLGHKMTTHHIVEPGTSKVGEWRKNMAERILELWGIDKPGVVRNERKRAVGVQEAWVSRRMLASAPHSDWLWVEDQNSDLHWAQLVAFFADLDKGEEIGGRDDGFVLIKNNDANMAHLKKLAEWPG